MTNLQKLFAAFIPVLAVACAAQSGTSDGEESSDAVSSKACVDATTLTCKAGYEVSTVGCAQSRVSGAHPEGKCVKATDDAGTEAPCSDTTKLKCVDGYEISEVGCAQSRVSGAHPQGRCVASEETTVDGGVEEDAGVGCTDMSELVCPDSITTDGCMQSRMVGAPTYARCTK